MTDYQGNSNKKKQEGNPETPEKNLEKVVVGEVVVRKPGLGERFKKIFLGGDMTTASQYVVAEVLFPALRNMAVDVVSKGMDRLVYGESGPRRRPSSTYAPRVQYNSPIYRQDASRGSYAPDRPRTWTTDSRRPFGNVTVSSKADADSVVEHMMNIVEQYEVVSVADLHELLGLPFSHVDNKWGWTHLGSIEVRQTREGYDISFPPTEEIS